MGDDKRSFFEKYHSFEKRIEAAIKEDDLQLVQILLGPKYCQLWQLWLIHGIISTKVLRMQTIVNKKLILNIVSKQMKIIKDQKKILVNQKQNLQMKDLNHEKIMIMSSKDLIKNLITSIRDSAVECRENLQEELNTVPDYRSYYIPEKLLRDSDTNNSEEFNFLFQQLSTVSNAEMLFLSQEVDCVITELSKGIENNIWEMSDGSTKTSYFIDQLVSMLEVSFNNEFGEALNKIVTPAVSFDVIVGGKVFPVGVIVIGVLNLLRNMPPLLLKLQENLYDNTASLPCVQNKLEEIERYIQCLENKALESMKLQTKLNNSISKIDEKILEKLKDGKFIDKQLMNDIYIKILHGYLNCAKQNKSNILYSDIWKENGNTEVIGEKILKEVKLVDHEKFGDLLHKELSDVNPNYNLINLFLINSTPVLSYKCLNQNANINLNKIMQKSYHTIMIDINNILFSFKNDLDYVDYEVMFASLHLPNKDGGYTNSCENSLVISGSKEQQDLILKVKKFAEEIERLIEVGGLNRTRGLLGFPTLVYIIYDFFKGTFFDHAPNSSKDKTYIHDKIREFYVKMSHSVAVQNEGMIKEYIEDIADRLKHEKNSDVRELYSIILGKKWVDIFRKKCKWNDTPPEHSLEYFMKITNKKINAFNVLQETNKALMTEENAKNAMIVFQRQNDKNKTMSELHRIFGHLIFSSDIGNEIKKLIFEKQDNIVQAVADFTTETITTIPAQKLLTDVILTIIRKCQMTMLLPKSVFLLNTVCMDTSFFKAISTCMNEIMPQTDTSVESLERMCSHFFVKNQNNRKSWLNKVFSNDQDLDSYIKTFRTHTEDAILCEQGGTTYPTTRPDIQGRIICEQFEIRLHLVESTQLTDVWEHRIIDKSGSKSVVRNNVLYAVGNTIHVLSVSDLQFFPILNKNKTLDHLQISNEVSILDGIVEDISTDFDLKIRAER